VWIIGSQRHWAWLQHTPDIVWHSWIFVQLVLLLLLLLLPQDQHKG
jgi:hypothetical protein